ncbi:hypothetical protein RQ479_21170 [Mesorhizobium sp. ISC25]|uniref:hypothetical protein n=1 Tax=Mesorhizobium sp. ISC25 TaxID=3077335 RepID=UPI0035E335C2
MKASRRSNSSSKNIIASPHRKLDPALRCSGPHGHQIRTSAVFTGWVQLTLYGSLAIPGIAEQIELDGLVVDLSETKDAILDVLEHAALEAVDHQAVSFEQELASLGKLKSIQLDVSKSSLIRKLALVFHVEIEPIDNVTLPFLVQLIPTFEVKAEGDFTSTMVSGALGFLSQAIGNLTIDDNGIGNIQPLIDNEHRRYGVTLDAGVKLADMIGVKLGGIVIESRGLSLPDSFSVTIKEYIPIPPYLAIGQIDGSVWVHPPGKFRVGATVVLIVDPDGFILQIIAAVTGNGPAQTIEVDGSLRIFTIPLFKAHGLADFRAQILSLDAETLPPLSAILAMKTVAKIDGKAKNITATSDLSLLGLKTTGGLVIHLGDDKLVVVTGSADWKSLGVKADLSLRTTTEFHHPSAGGHAQLGFIGVSSDFDIDTGHVKLGFKWKGIGLTVIAPNVGSVTPDLIKRLIESLFDFKFSFDQLKNMDIVVNLLDKNGNKTGSYGEGDAPGGNNGDGQGIKTAEEKHGGLAGGTVSSTEAVVPDSCPQRMPEKGTTRVWAKEPQIGAGNSIEGDHAGNVILISDDARVISDAMKNILNSSVVVACFRRPDSPHQPVHFKFSDGSYADIRSDLVAVLVPRDGFNKVLALEFVKGSAAVEIALPTGAETAIFGDRGLAGVAAWEGTPFGHRLLRKIVLAQLDAGVKIKAVHAVPQIPIIPGWEAKPVSLIEETKDGQDQIELTGALESDSVILTPDSDLYSLLKAEPMGTLAQLAAGFHPLQLLSNNPPPLIVRPKIDPACQLILIDDRQVSSRYALAFGDAGLSITRLVDWASWSQAMNGWLDSQCGRLVSLGAHTDLRIAPDQPVDAAHSQAVITGRTTDKEDRSQSGLWWLTTIAKPPGTAGDFACVTEANLKALFPDKSAVVRNPSILNWGDIGARADMLASLSGSTDVWSQNFFVNPLGLFRKAYSNPSDGKPCPTTANQTK